MMVEWSPNVTISLGITEHLFSMAIFIWHVNITRLTSPNIATVLIVIVAYD